MCVFPFRQVHLYLTFMLYDRKLPEFPSNQSLGGNLLLKNQDRSAVLNLHFKDPSASACAEL